MCRTYPDLSRHHSREAQIWHAITTEKGQNHELKKCTEFCLPRERMGIKEKDWEMHSRTLDGGKVVSGFDGHQGALMAG